MSCLGCQLANQLIEAHVVYEDEWITCILDIDPLNEGHTLILPKRHIRELDELDDRTLQSVMKASVLLSTALNKIYKPDGISILQNGGSFNDLDHYHMHVFPRYMGDGFGWTEPAVSNKAPLHMVKSNLRAMIGSR
ncbi:HIT family protein [Paenibacillus daejeonensis]|uniref:HIT family protein n=1 Tax=Paenibacillus daejeonensis TaxID=135193 RepID=UPI00037136A0|nr:HIT family protein [Paenibacillus daejeonensis]